MALAAVFSGSTLRSAGPLGVVYAGLQEALASQDQSAINKAQAAVEHLLLELLPGHVLGKHMCVADIWETMASVQGSRLGLGGKAVGRCGCGRSGTELAPSKMLGWQYNNAVSVNTHYFVGTPGMTQGVEVSMHNLTASAARHRSSPCCRSVTVYDIQVSPVEALCIVIHQADGAEDMLPELGNLLVGGRAFLLRAVVVRDGGHYTAYISAARLQWLCPDGWYHYDGMRREARLVYVGPSLRIEECHRRKIELLLFTCQP